MNPTVAAGLDVDMPPVTRQPDTEKMLLAIDTREVWWAALLLAWPLGERTARDLPNLQPHFSRFPVP